MQMERQEGDDVKQLIHNGVLVPKYEPIGFRLVWRGTPIVLTPEQEEMAVAWAKKLGTEYAQDPVFRQNFYRDFAAALNIPCLLYTSDAADE